MATVELSKTELEDLCHALHGQVTEMLATGPADDPDLDMFRDLYQRLYLISSEIGEPLFCGCGARIGSEACCHDPQPVV